MDIIFNTADASVSYEPVGQHIKDIYIDAKVHIPELNVEKTDVIIEKFQLNINDQTLKGMYINRHDENGVYVNSEVYGELNLGHFSKALGIEGFDLKGTMEVDHTVQGYYNPDTFIFPKSQGKFLLKNASLKTPFYQNSISQINADLSLINTDNTFASTTLVVDTLNFSFEKEQFSARARFSNFQNLTYDIQADGKFNLNKFYRLFDGEVENAEGYVEANLNLKGNANQLAETYFSSVENSGRLLFSNIAVQLPSFLKPFLLKQGQFEFSEAETSFKNFDFAYGDSNLTATGKFDNLVSYALSQSNALKGDLYLKSDYFNLNELIPSFDAKSNPNYDIIKNDSTLTDSYGVFDVPDNVDLSVKISAKQMIYDSLDLNNLSALFTLKNDSLFIQNSKFELIDAKAALSGFYSNRTKTEADFGLKIDIGDFDIKRAYNEINLFREMVTAAEYAEGISSVNYALKGKLDAEMYPVLPSLKGQGILKVKKAKIQGYKLFGAISKATKNESLSEADIEAIEIPSRIEDNIVTIDEFKMKTGMFRFKSEGEFSFDEEINFKMRLGLPPLGIIGIPLNVTGTSDNYAIKLGKRTEDLETVSYQDYLEMQKDSLNTKGLDSLQLQKLKEKYNSTSIPEIKKRIQVQKIKAIKEVK